MSILRREERASNGEGWGRGMRPWVRVGGGEGVQGGGDGIQW